MASRASCSVLFVLFCVLFVLFVLFGVLPADAQVQFAGQINSLNGIATIANPVYYTESIMAIVVYRAS